MQIAHGDRSGIFEEKITLEPSLEYGVVSNAPFNFSKLKEWPKWFWQFQWFHQPSGLNDKSLENQVNTLTYTMGDVADDILSSSGLGNDKEKNYDTVMETFNKTFC